MRTASAKTNVPEVPRQISEVRSDWQQSVCSWSGGPSLSLCLLPTHCSWWACPSRVTDYYGEADDPMAHQWTGRRKTSSASGRTPLATIRLNSSSTNIYTDRHNTFRKSLRKARSEHYRAEIEKAGGNIRLVYEIANALLGRGVDRPLPEGSDATHAALATLFQRSFTE